MSAELNRRLFVKASVLSAVAMPAIRSLALDAKDKVENVVNVAVIGYGAEGEILTDAALKIPGIRFKAVCDVWEYRRKMARGRLRALGHDVKVFEDYKEMLAEMKGQIEAVIIATHYPFYNKHGMFYTRIYQERSYVMAIRAAEPYPGGMFLSAEEPIRSLRSCKTKDGEIILVGGARHKTGQSEDTWQHYEQLYDFVSPYFTVKEIPYRWSAQDCMTIDSLPYAGYYAEDTPGLYLATGFGKWGMTNSMASAMLLRDLIIKGESPWKDVYSPARHVSPSAMVSFAAENYNVAKSLISGKLEPLEKDKDFALAPGEGQAVEINGERAGAFRGDDGLLYVINTTCTHMGCETNWNTAEHTWDCPCHGSRFSPQGRIIEGPAVKEPVLGEDVNPVGKLLTEDF